MKKFLISLLLLVLSAPAWAHRVVTFETNPGAYAAVIPLTFNEDGVTLSVYGTARPPGYSFYTYEPSFIHTSRGTITSFKIESPTGPFIIDQVPLAPIDSAICWNGLARKVEFYPSSARAQTGRILVTIDDDLEIKGDVNNDKEINVADINALIDIIMGSPADDDTLRRADLTLDNEFSLADVNVLIDIIILEAES